MRKTKEITIQSENRDRGKTYLLTEMPAAQAEKWAAQAFLALAKSGVEIPDSVAAGGLAGVAASGLAVLSGISWDLAEPLLDEMMGCVKIKEAHLVRALDPNAEDIEEVSTRLLLRKELLELHLGFSLAAKLSTSKAPAASQAAPITSMLHRGSE